MRWRTLPPLAALVLLMHALLWQGVAASRGTPPTAPAAPTPALVRLVTLPPAAPAVAVVAEPAPPRPQLRRPRPPPAVPLRVVSPEAVPELSEPSNALPDVTLAQAEPVAARSPARVAQPSTEPSVPTYRTRIAPAATLVYDLRRGMFSGRGELQWRPGDGRYTARLQGTLAGLSVLTWTSEGAFDAAGIAPLRFTDRRTRGMHAANFRRDSGTITFSGPSTEYPLLPGTQDRLSWMLQLPAIVSAAPTRFSAPGARISLFVAGARGDADVWVFQVRGTDTITLGDGSPLTALKLVREPRKDHDTHAEVWLDPTRHHLPVRARLTAGKDTLELLLQDASPLQ